MTRQLTLFEEGLALLVLVGKEAKKRRERKREELEAAAWCEDERARVLRQAREDRKKRK